MQGNAVLQSESQKFGIALRLAMWTGRCKIPKSLDATWHSRAPGISEAIPTRGMQTSSNYMTSESPAKEPPNECASSGEKVRIGPSQLQRTNPAAPLSKLTTRFNGAT